MNFRCNNYKNNVNRNNCILLWRSYITTELAFLTGVPTETIESGAKCGTNYNSGCASTLHCQGYMGTSANVMSGTCQNGKTYNKTEVSNDLLLGK